MINVKNLSPFMKGFANFILSWQTLIICNGFFSSSFFPFFWVKNYCRFFDFLALTCIIFLFTFICTLVWIFLSCVLFIGKYFSSELYLIEVQFQQLPYDKKTHKHKAPPSAIIEHLHHACSYNNIHVAIAIKEFDRF